MALHCAQGDGEPRVVVRMKLGKSLRRMDAGNPGTQSITVLSRYPFLSCSASACVRAATVRF
jgi:hypothetical protein